jgi:hypothetical protein
VCRLATNSLLFGVILISQGAWSAEPVNEPDKSAPCAILQKFDGDIVLMDPSKTRLVDIKADAPIPCGGWVSVNKGWAQIIHRQGHLIRTGGATLIEIYDNEKEKHLTGYDQIILFKGKILTRVRRGGDELTVLTPNARAYLPKGVAMTMYSEDDNESQLIALHENSFLENRFQPRKIEVKPGEVTKLNLNVMRSVPETPMAINVASFKKMVDDIPLEEKEYKAVVKVVSRRTARRFATNLMENPGRKPASHSAGAAAGNGDGYEQHRAYADDPKVFAKWLRKLVGGLKDGEEFMFPKSLKKEKKRTVQAVSIIDPDAERMERKRHEEELEKKRLIQALSKIKVE